MWITHPKQMETASSGNWLNNENMVSMHEPSGVNSIHMDGFRNMNNQVSSRDEGKNNDCASKGQLNNWK